MSTQTLLADEQITGEDLLVFSLEELEELLLQIYPVLDETFQEVSGYAQGVTQVETQLQKVVGLEKYFKGVWQELKATVDAILIRAVFSEWGEQERNTNSE